MRDEARTDPEEQEPRNPLLTPKEREALRAARELCERSERIVRAAARASRSKEWVHHFPPPAADS